MLIETIDRYLTEVRRQLTITRPAHDSTNWKICTDTIVRSSLRRLRTKLVRQRLYRLGYDDRIAGAGLRCNDGAYLDGYHSDGGLYYLTFADLGWLDRRFGLERLY